MDHKNITNETKESASQCVHFWKSLIQKFGVTLLYIKEEANVFADSFRRIPMAHQAHKLADTALDEGTYELMCLDSLLISDDTDCFSLDI